MEEEAHKAEVPVAHKRHGVAPLAVLLCGRDKHSVGGPDGPARPEEAQSGQSLLGV